MQTICAVVVTYNRKELLRQCLQALQAQTRPLDEILVVNNASVDGTSDMLVAEFPDVQHLELPENIGGAGGFAAGMKFALELGINWAFILDDDLLVSPRGVEFLLNYAESSSQNVVVGGVVRAYHSQELVWPIKLAERWHFDDTQLPDTPFPADTLAFLGILIPGDAIQEVGLPRSEFFINADDIEYSYRLKKTGYRLFYVPQSKLSHPMPDRRVVKFFGKTIFFELSAPWKIYYEIRNRYLLGTEYFGLKFWYKYFPLLLLKSLLLILYSRDKTQTLRHCLKGLAHAIVGRTGRLD